MQTDIPLKRLTALRAADLLPLLGAADTQVLAVESLELPASATRLDNVLRLRSPHGQEYLHVLEWQGYHDTAVLWRCTGYLAWLGQRDPARTIIGTLIYLTPTADVGDTLQQTVDGQPVTSWRLPVVRLWELEAADALQHGTLGLAVLSLLMHGASATLVEQAADLILHQAPLPQQADLLSILGVFAEPLIAPARFADMVGKERLMASDLLTYLMDEKLAEVEKQHAAELATKDAELASLQRALHDAVEDAVALRFPNTPAILMRNIRRITDPAQLQALHTRALQAPDQAAVERLLAELVTRDA